jgi:ABC-type spermidine/putrescine transport system permease subunit II
VLLKNSSVLCLCFLTLPLVGVCALSIRRKERCKCWGTRYLLKNTVIFFLQLYFLALPLVGMCALSIHENGWCKCWGARYLSKITVIFFLQLYFLTLPLVGVCALSIHQRGRCKCWGARYLSNNRVNFLSAAVLPNPTASWRMRVIYISKGAMIMLGCALSIEEYS